MKYSKKLKQGKLKTQPQEIDEIARGYQPTQNPQNKPLTPPLGGTNVQYTGQNGEQAKSPNPNNNADE